MGLNPLARLLVSLGALVLGVTVHEFSHCLMAYRLGDRTGQRMGRLTLNPLAHLDPMGTLMMVISALSGFGIGWGKPAPVSPWSLRPRGRAGMALVALAGPLSNFAIAAVLSLALRLLPAVPFTGAVYMLYVILLQVVVINLGLTAFNLLPLPMLDGFHVLMGIIGSIRANWAYDLGNWLARLEPHGPMILLVLVMLGGLTRSSFSPLTMLVTPVFNLLVKLVGLS